MSLFGRTPITLSLSLTSSRTSSQSRNDEPSDFGNVFFMALHNATRWGTEKGGGRSAADVVPKTLCTEDPCGNRRENHSSSRLTHKSTGVAPIEAMASSLLGSNAHSWIFLSVTTHNPESYGSAPGSSVTPKPTASRPSRRPGLPSRGAMTALSTLVSPHSGQEIAPAFCCASNPSPSRNQASNWWPRAQRRANKIIAPARAFLLGLLDILRSTAANAREHAIVSILDAPLPLGQAVFAADQAGWSRA